MSAFLTHENDVNRLVKDQTRPGKGKARQGNQKAIAIRRQDKARHNKRREAKRREDKARQGKPRQDKESQTKP